MVMVTLVTPISMTGGSVRPSIGEPPEHGTSAIVKASSLVPGSGEACGSANDHLAATGSPSSSADHRPPGAGLVTGCAAHPASSSPVSTIDAFILDPQPPCPTHRPRGPAERARPSSPSQCGTTRSAVDRRRLSATPWRRPVEGASGEPPRDWMRGSAAGPEGSPRRGRSLPLDPLPACPRDAVPGPIATRVALAHASGRGAMPRGTEPTQRHAPDGSALPMPRHPCPARARSSPARRHRCEPEVARVDGQVTSRAGRPSGRRPSGPRTPRSRGRSRR